MGKESKALGNSGEDKAVAYLSSIGYNIIERNFHSSQGEIDIVAQDKEFIVFIEVKYYSFRSYGSPLGAVRRSKKDSMIHAAQTYLMKKNIKDINCRFDVIAIYREISGELRIDHIKDAFYAC